MGGADGVKEGGRERETEENGGKRRETGGNGGRHPGRQISPAADDTLCYLRRQQSGKRHRIYAISRCRGSVAAVLSLLLSCSARARARVNRELAREGGWEKRGRGGGRENGGGRGVNTKGATTGM